MSQLYLSALAYYRILKLARTVADSVTRAYSRDTAISPKVDDLLVTFRCTRTGVTHNVSPH